MFAKPHPYLLPAVLAILLAIAGCDKEKDKDEDPGTTTDSDLVIKFSSTSIKLDKVDSAILFLTKQNTTDTIVKHFARENGNLGLNMEGVAPGEWSSAIFIYGRINNDPNQRRYDLSRTLTISTSANITLNTGPNCLRILSIPPPMPTVRYITSSTNNSHCSIYYDNININYGSDFMHPYLRCIFTYSLIVFNYGTISI